MEKSIIIIGAGIAGLSAGCYGRMNDYRTTIFEMHSQPGGLCTAWRRRGYTFDGCLHWLVGTRPGAALHTVWEELGALRGRHIFYYDEFYRLQDRQGRTCILYTDVDRLERHLLEIAPADAQSIREFTAAIRLFSRFDPPPGKPAEISSPWENLAALPGLLAFLPAMYKWRNITLAQLAERFGHPLLRQTVATFGGDYNEQGELAALFLVITLAWLNNRNAGFPQSGSLEFAQAIEQRYRELGGEIRYRARVQKILVENDRAVGVRLADGTEHRADIVISAADGHATIFDMLAGKYVDDEIRDRFARLKIFQPVVQVSLGVARPQTATPHHVIYELDKPVTLAGVARRHLSVRHYSYDSTMAPPGKSVINVLLISNYAYWQTLAADAERYAAEKKQIALAVIAQLEKFLPGLGGQVEAVEVSTPLTYEKYTGNWQGSMEGWVLTPELLKNNFAGRGMRKTLPGLANFYMIGQWVEPGGGVPTAALSARNVMQIICHHDKRPFVVTRPAA